MAISLRSITDRQTFRDATESPRDSAAIYFFKQLDPYYESALAVANDLYARPQLYTNLPGSAQMEPLGDSRRYDPDPAEMNTSRLRCSGWMPIHQSLVQWVHRQISIN